MEPNTAVFLAEEHRWSTGASNPLTCSGVTCDTAGLAVEWDNGRRNSYSHDPDKLLPVIQPTRNAARAAAARNRNLTIDRVGEHWVLKLKKRLVINDDREEL